MQQAAAWLLLYLVLPIGVAVGFADGLCHRATNIATTSGLKENLLHWLMFVQIAVAVAAALLLDITAAVLVLVFIVFVLHEATVYWDLSYSTLRRDVGPFEQMVHSFQEMLPLIWLLLLSFIALPQALAIFGRGSEAADWSLRLKPVPLPAEYLLTAAGLALVFNVLFLMAETWSCLRARRVVAEEPSASSGRVEPRLD
jgi:hypothetical protein